MTYKTPEHMRNGWNKTKEILSDAVYDIELASKNVQSGIHKGIFNRRLWKLHKMSDEILELTEIAEAQWTDGESIISCQLYRNVDIWELEKYENGNLLQQTTITLREELVPWVVGRKFDESGEQISCVVATDGIADDYRDLSATVKQVLDFIETPEKLISLPAEYK